MLKRVTAIDIGSTNSQIALCYHESTDDGQTWNIAEADKKDNPQQYLLCANGVYDIPTFIVKKDDVPQNISNTLPAFKYSDVLVGADAINLFERSADISGRSEFKKDFFCSNEELIDDNNREKFERAKESIKIMLQYLKKVRDNAAQQFINQNYEEETIITVPLRATDFERSTMRTLAEEVGFENIQIRDEATAILRYALMVPDSALLQRLQNLTVNQNLSVLIVDIGGSTTDILLVKINPDGNGGFNIDEVGRWPKIGEKNTLGGIDIDKKIANWFKNKNYVASDFLENTINKCGYVHFRKFKEEISYRFSRPDTTGQIDSIASNLNSLLNHKKNLLAVEYPQDGIKGMFNIDTYINEIAEEYLPSLYDVIRAVLVEYGIQEEDIDCVVTSGGGAQMYGIEQLLKGEDIPTVEEPLKFTRVQENPKMYIKNEEISSALCAIGSVWPLPKIKFKNACPCDYFFKVNIYVVNTNTANNWRNQRLFDTALPDMSNYRPLRFNDGTGRPYEIEYHFAEKNAPLPIEKIYQVRFTINMQDNNNNGFIVLLSLWSKSDNDEKHFQKGWATSASTTLIAHLINLLSSFLPPPLRRTDPINASFVIEVKVAEDFKITLKLTANIDGHSAVVIDESH